MHPAVVVDWDLAARMAARVVRTGPTATRDERLDLVAGLHDAAARAVDHAAAAARLPVPARPARVRVVDRASWARANVRSLAALADAAGVTRRDPSARRPAPVVQAARGAGGAVELAAALGALSGAVLGQLDPWGDPDGHVLLLVAPNVLTLERSLRVDPADFRLWVTLHEQTHALQMAAAPWLPAHVADRLGALLDGPQGPALDEVGAVMALLEGHADVTMDAVGRTVVPSVRQIRRRFDARRAAGPRATAVRRAVRALLGVDAKVTQYRDGAVFVRRVRRTVGTDGLNAVWSAPDALPTPAEIADPAAWVRRVHG